MDRGGLAPLVDATRSRLRRSAVVAAALWLGVLLALVLAVAWLVADPEGWRRGSPAPLVLDIALVSAAIVASILVAGRIRDHIAEARIAEGLDGLAGFGRGTVLGALELSRATPRGVSGSLARRSEERVMGSLPSDSERLAGSLDGDLRRWALRGGMAFAASVVVLAVLALVSPDRAFSAWGGLLRPDRVLTTSELAPLRVEPGSAGLPRGSEVVLTISAEGRRVVTAHWQFDGDVAHTEEAEVADDRATVVLGVLDAPVEYEVSAPDGARTERFRIVPLDPLLVTDLRIDLLFPPHTGLSPRQLSREAPALDIPAGTRLRFQGRASRDLSAVSLQRIEDGAPAGAPVALGSAESRFFGEWTPERSGLYRWSLEGMETAGEGLVPQPLDITVVPDSVPVVELIFPARDTVLAIDRRQPLVIETRDDYGIARVDLISRRISSAGEADPPVVEELRAGGIRAAVARPVLDLSDRELLPGDTVRYRVRVVDNHPLAQTAETREYALRVPRRTEVARAVQDQLESVAARVDSLRAESERTAEETRELERQGIRQRQETSSDDRGSPGQASQSPEREASFQAREDARRALERQEGLLSQTDSIRSELDRIRRALDEGVLPDPELRRDVEELDRLMEEAASEEMRRENRELADSLGQMSADEIQDALQRMARNQEELQERVDEAVERFQRAAAEQDFRTTADEARELAREEEALADELEQPGQGDSDDDSGLRADQQDDLAERSRRLQDRMESLEQRLGQMGEEQARQGVQQARQNAEQASSNMDRAAQSLSRQNPSDRAQAGDAAQSAYQDLQQAADDLDQARQEMRQRQDQIQQQAFRRAASEALSLARRQSEIQDEIRESRQQNPDAQGDQAAVQDGLRNLAESLSETRSQGSEGQQQLEESLERAEQAVAQVAESMQNQSGDQPSPSAASNEAVEALNELARSASQSARSQQGQGQQSEQSSGGQTGRRLQELAQAQAGLSDQSGAVQTMQLGRASMERQLRQIAAEQGRIGRELSQMSVRPGQNGQILGDVRSLAREARDLAREVEGGRLDPEVIRRQERLFHRLLDAGRSLEQDEFSSDRESRTADAVPPALIDGLTLEDLGGGRIPLPESELLQELPPARRALVIRYFELLNQSEALPAPEGPEVP